MNAYELADKLETDKWDEATIVLSIDAGIKMLRQQADRIAELEKQVIGDDYVFVCKRCGDELGIKFETQEK